MPSEVTKIFADRLQDLIASSGLSIKELSSNIKISTGALSKYQNDVSEAGIDALAKIAGYFNVSADYLLGLTDDPKKEPSTIDQLGLSEESIENIQTVSSIRLLRSSDERIDKLEFTCEVGEILDCYLSNKRLLHLMFDIKKAADAYSSFSDLSDIFKKSPTELNDDDDLSAHKNYLTWLAVNDATKMVEETICKYYDNTKDGVTVYRVTQTQGKDPEGGEKINGQHKKADE